MIPWHYSGEEPCMFISLQCLGNRCIALLCLAILRPFKYGCSHGSIHNWGTTFGTKESRTMSHWYLEVLS